MTAAYGWGGPGIAMEGDNLVICSSQETPSPGQRCTAYVYRRQDDGSWQEIEKKYGEDYPNDIYSGFGGAVSLQGNTLAIGYVTGVCPNVEDEPFGVPGVHIFESSSDCTGIQLGDVNGDGEVNLLDVAPFVSLLSDGGFQQEADINQDGMINLLDVAPFVDLLSGG